MNFVFTFPLFRPFRIRVNLNEIEMNADPLKTKLRQNLNEFAYEKTKQKIKWNQNNFLLERIKHYSKSLHAFQESSPSWSGYWFHYYVWSLFHFYVGMNWNREWSQLLRFNGKNMKRNKPVFVLVVFEFKFTVTAHQSHWKWPIIVEQNTHFFYNRNNKDVERYSIERKHNDISFDCLSAI